MQTLASIDLKPALVRGEVRRLSETFTETESRADDPGIDRHDTSQTDGTGAHAAPDSDDPHFPPTAPASNSEDRSQDEQVFAKENEPPPVKTPRARKRRSSGPHVANGKDPWGDEEIKKLIKWKAQGMTHKEAGVSILSHFLPTSTGYTFAYIFWTSQARLGRTEPACAIRHSIVLKQNRWIEFTRAYRAKMAAGETSDEEEAESESEVEEEGEQANENEEMEEAEEQEDVELDKETEKDDGKEAFEMTEEAVEK